MLCNRIRHIIFLVTFIVSFLPVSFFGKFVITDKKKITWEESYQTNGITVFPGSLNADFGKFNFQWIINNRNVRLITLEASGGGELPPIEKKVFVLINKGGTTVLFIEQFPLLNAKEPVSLKAIASVSTKDIFSVLSNSKTSPISPNISKTQPINWEPIYNTNNSDFLHGFTKAPFGTLNIYWKKKKGNSPEFITFEQSGSAELPPREVKLMIWNEPSSENTFILQEKYPQLNEMYPPYLWVLCKVKKEEILSGYNLINQQKE